MLKKNINCYSQAELLALREQLETEYAEIAAKKLSLNMARGKPAGSLLDNNVSVLDKLDAYIAQDGTDGRNYGILEGLPEMRAFFGEVLNLDPERIIVGGNSSLNLMYDAISRWFVFGII